MKSIAITTQPTKTDYVVGEYFNPEGMVVTATFDVAQAEGGTQEVQEPVTGYTWVPDAQTQLRLLDVVTGIYDSGAREALSADAYTVSPGRGYYCHGRCYNGDCNRSWHSIPGYIYS